MVRQWQDLFFQNRYSGSDKSLHKKDFIKAAHADGFGFARRISGKEEVRAVLEEFVRHSGPAFVEAMVDQRADVFPMVPAGMGYKDMITGTYITAREVVRPDPKKIDPSSMF
jgi:acetolactate synthase I/II/III large subunit